MADRRTTERDNFFFGGPSWAPIYDTWGWQLDEGRGFVSVIKELAGDGKVLELGVGTGRLALPLAEAGLDVHGIDLSQAMLDVLRAKDPDGRVRVWVADMVDFVSEDRYAVIYIALNGIFALTEQARQLACLRNAVHHLTPNGVLVIEAQIEDTSLFVGNQYTIVTRMSPDGMTVVHALHHSSKQLIQKRIIRTSTSEKGSEEFYVQYRYATPAELDAMATCAGLELYQRWGSYRKDPFHDFSKQHLSIYGRPMDEEELTRLSAGGEVLG